MSGNWIIAWSFITIILAFVVYYLTAKTNARKELIQLKLSKWEELYTLFTQYVDYINIFNLNIMKVEIKNSSSNYILEYSTFLESQLQIINKIYPLIDIYFPEDSEKVKDHLKNCREEMRKIGERLMGLELKLNSGEIDSITSEMKVGIILNQPKVVEGISLLINQRTQELIKQLDQTYLYVVWQKVRNYFKHRLDY